MKTNMWNWKWKIEILQKKIRAKILYIFHIESSEIDMFSFKLWYFLIEHEISLEGEIKVFYHEGCRMIDLEKIRQIKKIASGRFFTTRKRLFFISITWTGRDRGISRGKNPVEYANKLKTAVAWL